MGLGPTAYTYHEPVVERVPYDVLLGALVSPYFYFLLGYAIWIILEHWFVLRRLKVRANASSIVHIDPLIVAIFGGLGLFGHLMSSFAFSLSDIGTIFPVMGTLLYPAVVLAVASYRPMNFWSNISAVVGVGCTGYFATFSLWRSQLIMMVGALALAGVIRMRRRWPILLILSVAAFYIILPFQQLKRVYPDEFYENPAAFFRASLKFSWSDRHDIAMDFVNERINGAREMAFVQAALNNHQIELRSGMGYIDVLQQLVPRVVWPGKPSLNQTTGYTLPREVGLVGWEDYLTSWAVGLWAEMTWNFPYIFLLVFVSVAFFASVCFDRSIDRFIIHPTGRWVAHAALFFMFLQLVSLISFVTYAIWLFVLIALIDRIFLRPAIGPGTEAFRKSSNEGFALRRG